VCEGPQCVYTEASWYAPFYWIMLVSNVLIAVGALTVLSIRIRTTPENAAFLQKLRATFGFAAICMIFYWIDPQGWRGIIPLNVNLAALMIACSFNTSGTYLIGSALLSTLGKISPELVERLDKGDSVKGKMINGKHFVDVVCFILIIALPDYTWLVFSVYHIYTAIVYVTINGITVYAGFHLVQEMQKISANTKNSDLTDATMKIKHYVRDTIVSEIVIRAFTVATIVWWLMGRYSPSNWYGAPSFAMCLFINYSGLLDSMITLVSLNLYSQFQLGAKVSHTGKDSLFMTLLSKIFVSGQTKTLSSDAMTSGASVRQQV